MNRKTVYLVLAIAGAVVPYIFFTRFFLAEGLGGDFVGALFVNGAAGGFSADLLITSVVFWLFAFAEARRLGMPRPWLLVVVNLLIGLSCALPFFLYQREGHRERVAG